MKIKRHHDTPLRLSVSKCAASIMAALLLGFTRIPAQNSSITELTSSGPRPLADVVDQLQQLTHTPVNFEEAPLENAVDVATKTIDTISGPHQIALLKGGTLAVALTPEQKDAYTIAQAVPNVHASLKLGGFIELCRHRTS